METRLLKVKEAAEYLGLSKSTIYNLIKRKQIPFVRLTEKRIMLRESDIRKWVESRIFGSGDVWLTPGWKP